MVLLWILCVVLGRRTLDGKAGVFPARLEPWSLSPPSTNGMKLLFFQVCRCESSHKEDSQSATYVYCSHIRFTYGHILKALRVAAY